jgi:hypothetical protein
VRGNVFVACRGHEGELEFGGDEIAIDEESGKYGSLETPWAGGNGYS